MLDPALHQPLDMTPEMDDLLFSDGQCHHGDRFAGL
jgi:hypothetical protein